MCDSLVCLHQVPENIEKLRKLGAMAAILNAMGAHPENAEFQQLGSRLLAKIAGESSLKEAVDSVAVRLCSRPPTVT